jgi:hypothetical protein
MTFQSMSSLHSLSLSLYHLSSGLITPRKSHPDIRNARRHNRLGPCPHLHLNHNLHGLSVWLERKTLILVSSSFT